MKRIGIIAAVILVLVIAGILVINGRKIDTDVTREHTKVGVILNGVKNDRSWSQSHYEGMEQCAAKLNLDVEYREKVLRMRRVLTLWMNLSTMAVGS